MQSREVKWSWKSLLLPVEVFSILYSFSSIFQTLFYQQYYFQHLAKLKLLSLPNYTSPDYQICLTQDYVVNFTGNASFIDLQKQVNNLNMYSNTIYIASSFFSSIFLGPLSDKFGRKPLLLVVAVGMSLDTIMQTLVVYFDLSTYYFLSLLAIHGFTGGSSLASSMIFAIVADTTPNRWLGVRMSVLEATMTFGKAVAFIGTNNWIQSTNCNFLYPSLLNVGTALCAVVFLFLMRESFSPQEQNAYFSLRRVILAIFNGLRIFFNPYYLGFSNWWRAWTATGVICAAAACSVGGTEILNFFLHNRPLQWSYDKIGYFGAFIFGFNGLVLITAVPMLIAVRFSYPLVGLIGAVCGIIANVMVALVKCNWEMYVAGVFLGMQKTLFPVMRALLEQLVSVDDRGAIFSISTSCEFFTSVFASILFNQVYRPQVEVGYHVISASTAFWIMVAVWGACVPLLLCLQFLNVKQSEKGETQPLLDDGIKSDSVSSDSDHVYYTIQ